MVGNGQEKCLGICCGLRRLTEAHGIDKARSHGEVRSILHEPPVNDATVAVRQDSKARLVKSPALYKQGRCQSNEARASTGRTRPTSARRPIPALDVAWFGGLR